MLPEAILLEAQAELLNWQHSGMAVFETSHRSAEFEALIREAEADLRDLLHIPPNYKVLFLSGSARSQFSMIPLNFINEHKQAGYLISGVWSALAYDEAVKLKQAYCLGNSDDQGHFYKAPAVDVNKLQDNTSYVYYTPNETVNGVRFPSPPKLPGIPLIADMTSCLLTEPLVIKDYGLIFAGAQKNIAPAGLTLVIVADELLQTITNHPLPTMLDYRVHTKNGSLYATPPMFSCYMAGKMFKWLKAQGGVEALYAINQQKAKMLYDYIDASNFYHCPIEIDSRSMVNVCFNLASKELETIFLQKATAHGLSGLKGHKLVGGLRASLYNPMPIAGVEALLTFMDTFAKDTKHD